MTDPRTLSPLNLIPERIIQDLWGLGFTIIPRPRDPYSAADSLAPLGMAYQWCEASAEKNYGWKPVPASRHPGLFAPYGYTGNIEFDGLWLMEKTAAEVKEYHDYAHAKARQNVDNWFLRQAVSGFIGGVTMLEEGSGGERKTDIREIGDKTLENATKIPGELTPYIGQIFEERDRLWSNAGSWWGRQEAEEYQEYRRIFAEHPELTRGQIMNAVLTPIAIENIRKEVATEGANHEQSTNSDGTEAQAGTPAKAEG
jgi:hypothetical protein